MKSDASLTEAEAITHVLTYARQNRIPFPSVYTRNYDGGAIGVLVEGLDGNQSWICAGVIMSVQQGDVESRIADDIIKFGKPMADRVASIITIKH